MTDEEYVRSTWEEVRLLYGPGNIHEKPSERLAYVMATMPDGHEHCIASGTQAESWSAAAEYTRGRKRKIDLAERSLNWTEARIREGQGAGYDNDPPQHIRSMLIRELETLRKGMRNV